MTAPLNGKHVPAEGAPADPAREVAAGLYASQAEPEDPAFEDLSAEQQEDLTEYCRIAISQHLIWLVGRGFKIVPPGAAPLPQNQNEAYAMLNAAKAFFDGQKRGGKLATAPARKLVMPGGGSLQ